MNEKDKSRIDRLVGLLEASRWYEDPTFVGKDKYPFSYASNAASRREQVGYIARRIKVVDYWHPGAHALWDLIQEIESGRVLGSTERCCVCGRGPASGMPDGAFYCQHDECVRFKVDTRARGDDAIRAILAARHQWNLMQAKSCTACKEQCVPGGKAQAACPSRNAPPPAKPQPPELDSYAAQRVMEGRPDFSARMDALNFLRANQARAGDAADTDWQTQRASAAEHCRRVLLGLEYEDVTRVLGRALSGMFDPSRR